MAVVGDKKEAAIQEQQKVKALISEIHKRQGQDTSGDMVDYTLKEEELKTLPADEASLS